MFVWDKTKTIQAVSDALLLRDNQSLDDSAFEKPRSLLLVIR